MKRVTKTLALVCVAAVMMGRPCMAQEVEPPFTWAGEGVASFIGEGGTEEVDFQFELSIDEYGMFGGQTSSEDGAAKIQHVFYSEKKEYDFPGFFSRNLVIVLMMNEYGNAMLSVLNGRLLADRFLYGEVMLTGYEEGSDMANALGVGNPEATLMEGDELPEPLKSALKRCVPIGMVKIEGDYEAAAVATSLDSDTVDLFNGRNLEGWHTYLKGAGVDAKSVWKIQDGTIWCTGNPTGFIRTVKEYSDFELVLEWRWPEKPGNSGVLLHMSDEEKVWPLCMEAQLMHTRAGDFVGMGCDFNENKNTPGEFIRYAPRMNDSNEKTPGGWNTYNVRCKGDTMELTVNGRLQNKATGVSLRKGYIGLQSEGVPIVFRNIKLTPLK